MASRLQYHRRKPRKVVQACDVCHARKVRCNGDEPCDNCVSTGISCTYLSVPKKKGPKGPRVDKRLEFLKRVEHNAQVNWSPIQISSPQSTPQDIELPAEAVHTGGFGFHRSPILSDELIKDCLDGFFAHKHPIMPVLDRETIYASLPRLSEMPEQYGLITIICALIILQPEILDPSSPTAAYGTLRPTAEDLIAETLLARQYCDHIEHPSLAAAQTSFFLYAAFFCLNKDNSAWFYIREAMTILQLKRLHEESTYTAMEDKKYAMFCRRTFWLLFLTERAYALQRHRPLTLQRTIDLPTVGPGPEASIISGFLDLVSLFQNFDDNFLSLWNLPETQTVASPQFLVRLQEILKSALPNVTQRTEIQQADLLITRQWLKTMAWQLCVTKRLLSSTAEDESMSFHYPVTIARDVVLISRLLPSKAFEPHGVGILEKVFDIGCSLSDVVQLHQKSMQVSSLEIGPRDYLMELIRILGTVLGGNSKYLRLLASKADECLQVRIRASLSDSESLDEARVIVEIEDEDEFSQNGQIDDTMNYDSYETNEYQHFGGDVDLTVSDELDYYDLDLNTLLSTTLNNEQCQSIIPFMPTWDNIVNSDLAQNTNF